MNLDDVFRVLAYVEGNPDRRKVRTPKIRLDAELFLRADAAVGHHPLELFSIDFHDQRNGTTEMEFFGEPSMSLSLYARYTMT